MAVKDVLVEFATVIIYYDCLRLSKMSQEDLKKVPEGLLQSHIFEPLTNRMWTVDCENAWCQSRVVS